MGLADHDTCYLFYKPGVFHIVFRALKSRSSKQVAKYIDYLYLSVAALGIFASVIEYNHGQEVVREKFEVIRVGNVLDFMKEEYVGSYKYYRRNDKNAFHTAILDVQHCDKLDILLRIYGQPGGPKQLSDVQVLNSKLNMVHTMKKTSVGTVPINASGTVTAKMETSAELQQDITELSHPNLSVTGNFSEEAINRLRFTGYIMLATAAAIRITKVTVELGK